MCHKPTLNPPSAVLYVNVSSSARVFLGYLLFKKTLKLLQLIFMGLVISLLLLRQVENTSSKEHTHDQLSLKETQFNHLIFY